jgi:hypothetical protein
MANNAGKTVDLVHDFVQRDFFSPAEEIVRPRTRSMGESAERLKALSRPDMIRVAPEKYAWIPAAHCGEIPEYCLAKWVKCPADSLWRLIPVSGSWVRMTAKVAALLGWDGIGRKARYDTLKRLGNAGFIEFVHAAPGVHFLELRSWFRHLSDCQENPDMWEKGSDDLKTYQEANGLGGWKR